MRRIIGARHTVPVSMLSLVNTSPFAQVMTGHGPPYGAEDAAESRTREASQQVGLARCACQRRTAGFAKADV